MDHDLKKAVSTAKRLDLTLREDQLVFMQWLKSPLVVGIFLAPPCGTCSMARNIKLRDSAGVPIPGPVPLGSQLYPEGLPGLARTEIGFHQQIGYTTLYRKSFWKQLIAI